MQAIDILQQVKTDTETIINDKPQRFPDAAAVGDYWRQGDIYITKLAQCDGEKVQAEAQLAEGSTQGSRHILDSLDGVVMFKPTNSTVLTGPHFSLTKERTVTHPQHGDVVLPAGCYGITYQRAFADELRRVAD